MRGKHWKGFGDLDEDLKKAIERAFAPPATDTCDCARKPTLAERLFVFPAGQKERAVVSSWSATESFRRGLLTIAEASDMSATEVIRRAIFAIASNPELLRSEQVDRLERQYESTLGAGGRRTHRKPDTP